MPLKWEEWREKKREIIVELNKIFCLASLKLKSVTLPFLLCILSTLTKNNEKDIFDLVYDRVRI